MKFKPHSCVSIIICENIFTYENCCCRKPWNAAGKLTCSAASREHFFFCFVGSRALQWLFILSYRQNPFHHNQMAISLELFFSFECSPKCLRKYQPYPDIHTACRKKQQRWIHYFCHSRAQLWCRDSGTVDAAQILTKLEKRGLLMTYSSSVRGADQNREMVKGKLMKSFKICVRGGIQSGLHSSVGCQAVPEIRAACFYTGRLY